MLKKILLSVAASFVFMAASGQAKVNLDVNPDDPITTDQPVKISNNGRVVTKKGLSMIHVKDLAGMDLGLDTMVITLKPEALKQLDADKKANYEPLGKSKKSKKDRKNTSQKTDKVTERKVIKVMTIRESDGKVISERNVEKKEDKQ